MFLNENPNRKKSELCFTTFKNRLSGYDGWRAPWTLSSGRSLSYRNQSCVFDKPGTLFFKFIQISLIYFSNIKKDTRKPHTIYPIPQNPYNTFSYQKINIKIILKTPQFIITLTKHTRKPHIFYYVILLKNPIYLFFILKNTF